MDVEPRECRVEIFEITFAVYQAVTICARKTRHHFAAISMQSGVLGKDFELSLTRDIIVETLGRASR